MVGPFYLGKAPAAPDILLADMFVQYFFSKPFVIPYQTHKIEQSYKSGQDFRAKVW